MSEQQEDYITDAMEMMGISEPRQIVTEVSGFIPVFEVVLHHFKDHMTALVFGRMWQYCGMSDGVCRATLNRIADDLQISTATIMRHIEKLEADGYIYDQTPERRNRPHEYVDCGKVVMKGSLSAIAQKNVRLAQKNVAIAESQLIKQDNTNIKQESPSKLSMQEVTESANRKVDAILDMANFSGAKREARVNAILSYLGERFHVNTETKKWREFAKYADGQQQNHGEDIKVFVAWLYSQKNFDLAFWPPSKMMEFWPSAFVKVESSLPAVKVDDAGFPESY